jgi:Spt4/RpoE2 zinc finger
LRSNCAQFLANGCENCAFFGMDGDRVRVGDCTTPNFQSLLSVVDPASSWAAKWQHLSEFAPLVLSPKLVCSVQSLLSAMDPASSRAASGST